MRRREVEQVVLLETQEDKGLVMVDGQWVARDEFRNRPASARTELSDTLWPLLNPTPEGARMAMENLTALAARQKGGAAAGQHNAIQMYVHAAPMPHASRPGKHCDV